MPLTFIPTYADAEYETVLGLGLSRGAIESVSLVAIISIEGENQFDSQSIKKGNFARKRFLGQKPAKFSVTYVMLPDEEQNFWKRVLPLLRPKTPAGSAQPLIAVNPQINRIGIELVTVLSYSIGPADARDGRTISIELEEWTREPTPARAAAAASAGDAQDREPLAVPPAAVLGNAK
jgi:hypothetical protein